MNAKAMKDKLVGWVGGQPAQELPVETGIDGPVAIRPSQTELPSDEFRRELIELNKRISQHETEKANAGRAKELASKTAGREDSERHGQVAQQVIRGHQEAEKKADRAIQKAKDERINLFSPEHERIRAIRHAVWLKFPAEMIKSIKSQIVDAILSGKPVQDLSITFFSEKSEAYKKMAHVDTGIDSYNGLAKKNSMARNLFILNTEKLVGPYEAEARKTICDLKRRSEDVFKKFTSASQARASAESEQAKKRERQNQSSGWIPDKK